MFCVAKLHLLYPYALVAFHKRFGGSIMKYDGDDTLLVSESF